MRVMDDLLSIVSRPVADGWTPASVPGLVQWSRAGDVTNEVDEAVSYWPAAAGSALVAVPESYRPILRGNLFNGNPAIEFDGVNDNLTNTLSLMSQPYTMFYVLSVSNTGVYHVLSDGLSGTNRASVAVLANGNLAMYFGSGSETSLGPFPNNTATLLTVHANNDTSYARTNGVNMASTAGAVGTHKVTGFTLGARYTVTSPSRMKLAEWLVFSGTLSDENRSLVESYLSEKYGL
jgi:hypothetical protein